jgi:transcriptional regulator with XRE-family HTH domain
VDKSQVSPLGELIRRQRELNALSMRQFAAMVGISNPYLSQIERGLREPSEQVIDAIARSLQLSVDTLYEAAGFVDDEDDDVPLPVVEAIRADPVLTGRQRQALIEIYEAFAAKNGQRLPRRRRRHRVADGSEDALDLEVFGEAAGPDPDLDPVVEPPSDAAGQPSGPATGTDAGAGVARDAGARRAP